MKALFALAVLTSLALAPAQARASTHFADCNDRTGSNATLIIPTSAVALDGAEMEIGDEVAVFTPDGVCAGWALWDGNNTALALWGDNPMTQEIDGFVSAEPLRYAVWDASAGVEYGRDAPVEVSYHADFEDGGAFIPDAVYLVSSLVATASFGSSSGNSGAPLAFALKGNHPNPFSGRTTISYELPEEALVKLEVYNLLGHRIGVLTHEVQSAGRYEVPFLAGPDISSGVYVYRLQAGSHVSHRKMTLVN